MGGIKTPVEASTTQIKHGIQELISRAIKNDVSVIHIEPMSNTVVIRYRRGGTLYQATTLPKPTAVLLAKYFKQLAQLDINQTQAPQSGQYLQRLGRKTYVIQVSTLPVMDGEKLTLNLSGTTMASENLQALGLWGKNLSLVQQTLTQPSGLIVIAGQRQTETTMVQTTMLQLLAKASLAVAYVGDGQEPAMTGVKTVKIHPDAGWGYSRYAQVLAKQGFGIIGLNAMIDRRTAQAATKIADDGSLIIAAINAGTAVKGLLYIYQASHQLSSLVLTRAVIDNVFVRGLCPHCREAYWPTVEERHSLQAIFKIDERLINQQLIDLEKQAREANIAPESELSLSAEGVKKLWRAHLLGCKYCDNTGYGIRIGLFEVCYPTNLLLSAVSNHKSLAELQTVAVKEGLLTLKIDALIKTLRGVIDFPTLLKVCEDYNR
jgi:type II secretory ATPase GspE/PulE/Tfp pilus assembly ATPase PilB-like protein